MVEVKKSVCNWCKGECGVLVHVNNGRLVKATNDPDFPEQTWPRSTACLRLKAAREFFYHLDRVNFPLKRAGEKGEGKWRAISWEQALDEIAEGMKKVIRQYGPEALSFTLGTAYKQENPLMTRLFTLLNNPLNFASATNVCFWPRSMVANAIVGMFPHFSVRPSTKCIVSLGAEPLVSRPTTAEQMRQAIKNGAKHIVIDPRRTYSASKADVWLQLRPGTDAAVLMGMVNVIIEEGLYDREFVERWCHGFEELKQRAREYPPEKAAAISDVPAETIQEAARVYAANRPGAMIEGMGIEELTSNAEVLHARWILAALVGNLDVEGGEELTGPHPTMLTMKELEPRVDFKPEVLAKQIGADRFKFLAIHGQRMISSNMGRVWPRLPWQGIIAHGPSMWRAVLTGNPYPVRATITIGNNPLVTLPNTKLVYKALKSLDLFVVIDYWRTPSAELADYILPSACWLERPMLWDFQGYDRWIKAGEAAVPSSVPGLYEHKNEYEIWRELAIRFGYGDYYPWKTLEELFDARLKPIGYTHRNYVDKVRCEWKGGHYKKYEKTGFATPTGKAELYSTIMDKLDYDPLPHYQESAETKVSQPELAKEYPYVLITGGRIRQYYHSDFRQIDSVRKVHPDPLVQINPQTAAKLGIADGDWVWIETKRGRVRQKAELFDGLKPDVVHAEHGWWYPELPGEEPWLHGVWESNINVCLDDDPEVCNSLTGAYPLKTALCRIYRAKSYARP
ncbi:MAG: molybdopterin-dependent oxidoreductase [Chloroflexi bacterium]|nr:molybdopterin-dependent oxidoreductase [Chloroflexota bacterium]